MQHVTLGGTGNERGDRHPKIGNHVQIGVKATILGKLPLLSESCPFLNAATLPFAVRRWRVCCVLLAYTSDRYVHTSRRESARFGEISGW